MSLNMYIMLHLLRFPSESQDFASANKARKITLYIVFSRVVVSGVNQSYS